MIRADCCRSAECSALEVLKLAVDTVPFFGVGRRILLFSDVRPDPCEFGVQFDELLLVIRKLIFREDCVYRAFWFAQRAVDAFVGVNDEKVRALIKAVDGTDLDAVRVFALDAVFDDDESHCVLLPV